MTSDKPGPMLIQRILDPAISAGRVELKSPEQIYTIAKQRFHQLLQEFPGQEVLLVLHLDRKWRMFPIQTTFVGGIDSVKLYNLGQVFRLAIVIDAAAIVLAHNHPASEDPMPSPGDIKFTSNIVKVGELLNIPMADHIILGRDSFVSLARLGLGGSIAIKRDTILAEKAKETVSERLLRRWVAELERAAIEGRPKEWEKDSGHR